MLYLFFFRKKNEQRISEENDPDNPHHAPRWLMVDPLDIVFFFFFWSLLRCQIQVFIFCVCSMRCSKKLFSFDKLEQLSLGQPGQVIFAKWLVMKNAGYNHIELFDNTSNCLTWPWREYSCMPWVQGVIILLHIFFIVQIFDQAFNTCLSQTIVLPVSSCSSCCVFLSQIFSGLSCGWQFLLWAEMMPNRKKIVRFLALIGIHIKLLKNYFDIFFIYDSSQILLLKN